MLYLSAANGCHSAVVSNGSQKDFTHFIIILLRAVDRPLKDHVAHRPEQKIISAISC
jgi:hypothetical protein